MKKIMKKNIASKLKILILLITIIAVTVVALFSIGSMLSMRKQTLESVTQDSSARLREMAESKAEIADSHLLLAQNQTRLVADGITDIFSNTDKYLLGYNENNLPDLSCQNKDLLGKYSMHIRVPENLLKDIERDESETITYAVLDRSKNIGNYSVNQELYLSSLLSNELYQIERFRNADGSYTGFSATYFCFNDSGIDVLGDLETQPMICYDARNSGWYKSSAEGFKNGTLRNGVYWTDPVQDGSGRGISLICAIPVEVKGKFLGVAGSGGLLINFAELIESTRLGDTGYSFMVNRNTSKVIINPNTSEKTAIESEVKIETVLDESPNEDLLRLSEQLKINRRGILKCKIDGNNMLVAFSALKNVNWTMVTVINENDPLIMGTVTKLDHSIMLLVILFALFFIVLTVLVIMVTHRFSKRFTDPIILLKKGARTISDGDLSHRLSISTGDEIEELAEAFNHMAIDLEEYIKNLAAVTSEKERIGAELDIATKIQASMLPCIFPAFPEREEFEVFATMAPAKEVGGDFYDFFMVDDENLAIVAADVSGKGVPAALFMVIGKTLIKDHITSGKDLGEVFTEVNNLLCEANSEELFITAFVGVLNLKSGEFRYVNAGHEMPFIARKNEPFKPYKINAAFVLAGMEGMRYKSGMLTLEPGDKIFQYTDGVTEATDINNQLFGMERLEYSLGKVSDKTPEEILLSVKKDIEEFVGDAPQFDDITMICLDYKKRQGEI